MSLNEQFNQLLEEAKIKPNEKGKLVCPLTNKPPTLNRCSGQMWRRMMKCLTPCEIICQAELDDLKIRRYGGGSSIAGEVFYPPKSSNKSQS